MSKHWDVIVLGAGAAGMMCAIEAGKRGRKVLVVDHAKAPGEKIRISGGGRCNFTNLKTSAKAFLSQNPRFCISALSRYTQHDFIALVSRYGITWHEKTLGQLFCDGSSQQIIDMLTTEMRKAEVTLKLQTSISAVEKDELGFRVSLPDGAVTTTSLVVATGGKSIPKMGATGLAYDLAEKFGLRLVPTRPGLVPLTFDPMTLEELKELAGVAVDAEVGCGKQSFREAMLFTHRGISGPAILQISSYWREGSELRISMAAGVDVFDVLKKARAANGRQSLKTALSTILPKALAEIITEDFAGNIADVPDRVLKEVAQAVTAWGIKPVGSEGYRTAEVTLGGVDTRDLSSRTMEASKVPGLYMIGEAVDVTGWLGGYNFQWAWSSGWCAGQEA
jgi:predicted Rossmann fold flavoprotein